MELIMKYFTWLTLGLGLMLWGCAPAISPQLQQEAASQPAFAELAAHPDNYRRRLVVLGGEVMSVQPWGPSGSLLAVDQRPLDARFFPVGNVSGGTFLVESDEWLNSNWFVPKSRVLAAGAVQGQRDGQLVLKARKVDFLAPPVWEKWFYPVPREWYDHSLEYWYTPPYFDIYRPGTSR
jgi:starvation-inducible outer membrane lipoprotein